MDRQELKPTLLYYRVGNACCGDDFFQAISSRYDLERLGVAEAESIESANLFVIQGWVSGQVSEELRRAQENNPNKTWVLALGACACGGGFFPNSQNEVPHADVWVPGCPPRPEAIMNGVIALRSGVVK